MNGIFHLSFHRNPPGCRNADIPHVHKHHELLYCTAGEGGQLADHREFSLRAGDLFFYPAGMRHCSVFQSGCKFDCYVLGFQSPMFTPALPGDKEALSIVEKMTRFNGKVPLSIAGGETVRQIIEELYAEFRQKAVAYHAAMKMMMLRLLISITRDDDFHRQGIGICLPPSNDEMIREVLHYLDAFYMNHITIDSLIEFCPMSRSHFHAMFKKTTGKTLIEYLTHLRLEKAKEHLRSTDMSIGDIASRTGFATASYFGQIFHEATGVSPGKYRKRFALAPLQGVG